MSWYSAAGFQVVGTRARLPCRSCPSWIQAATARQPDRVALETPERSLTYAELRDAALAGAGETEKTDSSIKGDIKWNFTKFLVDRNGHVVRRFEPAVTPDSKEVVNDVEQLLKQ